MYCHYHNKENEHVGTGVSRSGKRKERVKEAAQRAIGSALDSESRTRLGVENLERGSMGCGATNKEAHQNALKANSFQPEDEFGDLNLEEE